MPVARGAAGGDTSPPPSEALGGLDPRDESLPVLPVPCPASFVFDRTSAQETVFSEGSKQIRLALDDRPVPDRPAAAVSYPLDPPRPSIEPSSPHHSVSQHRKALLLKRERESLRVLAPGCCEHDLEFEAASLPLPAVLRVPSAPATASNLLEGSRILDSEQVEHVSLDMSELSTSFLSDDRKTSLRSPTPVASAVAVAGGEGHSSPSVASADSDEVVVQSFLCGMSALSGVRRGASHGIGMNVRRLMPSTGTSASGSALVDAPRDLFWKERQESLAILKRELHELASHHYVEYSSMYDRCKGLLQPARSVIRSTGRDAGAVRPRVRNSSRATGPSGVASRDMMERRLAQDLCVRLLAKLFVVHLRFQTRLSKMRAGHILKFEASVASRMAATCYYEWFRLLGPKSRLLLQTESQMRARSGARLVARAFRGWIASRRQQQRSDSHYRWTLLTRAVRSWQLQFFSEYVLSVGSGIASSWSRLSSLGKAFAGWKGWSLRGKCVRRRLQMKTQQSLRSAHDSGHDLCTAETESTSEYVFRTMRLRFEYLQQSALREYRESRNRCRSCRLRIGSFFKPFVVSPLGSSARRAAVGSAWTLLSAVENEFLTRVLQHQPLRQDSAGPLQRPAALADLVSEVSAGGNSAVRRPLAIFLTPGRGMRSASFRNMDAGSVLGKDIASWKAISGYGRRLLCRLSDNIIDGSPAGVAAEGGAEISETWTTCNVETFPGERSIEDQALQYYHSRLLRIFLAMWHANAFAQQIAARCNNMFTKFRMKTWLSGLKLRASRVLQWIRGRESRFSRGLQRTLFCTWRERYLKQYNADLRRSVAARKHVLLWKCFRSWRRFILQRIKLFQHLFRVQTIGRRIVLVRAFAAWRVFQKLRRVSLASRELARSHTVSLCLRHSIRRWKEALRRRRVLVSVFKRADELWEARCVMNEHPYVLNIARTCFRAWRESVLQSDFHARHETRLLMCNGFLKMRLLRAAWRRWLQAFVHSHVVQKICSSREIASLRRSWAKWLKTYETSQVFSAHLAKITLLRRVFARWIRSVVAYRTRSFQICVDVFACWRFVVRRRCEHRPQRARALFLKRRALTLWRRALFSAVQAVADARKAREWYMGRLLYRWRISADVSKRNRALDAAALRSANARALKSAFGDWLRELRREQRSSAVLCKAAARRRVWCLKRALRSWLQFVGNRQAAKAAGDRADRFYVAKLRLRAVQAGSVVQDKPSANETFAEANGPPLRQQTVSLQRLANAAPLAGSVGSVLSFLQPELKVFELHWLLDSVRRWKNFTAREKTERLALMKAARCKAALLLERSFFLWVARCRLARCATRDRAAAPPGWHWADFTAGQPLPPTRTSEQRSRALKTFLLPPLN